MITIVLIDNEGSAIKELESSLELYKDLSIVGMFTNPLSALEEIEKLKPDVVFLDIRMQPMHGIDVAIRIRELCPKADIVFVTAYDNYAVDAFNLEALDYILKPINSQRLKKTINRIMKKRNISDESNSQRLYIRCFGCFKVGWEGQKPIKWRTQKTKELFAFLLYNHNHGISKDEILDKLWPEDNPYKAIKQLYNGVYYIRKTLEEYGVDRTLIDIGDNYNVKVGEVDWDVRNYYELEKRKTLDSISVLEEIEDLCKGDYLEGEEYSWVYREREKFQKLSLNGMINLARLYFMKGQKDKAERKLIEAYNINPYEDEITELLMRIYIDTGDKNKAKRHFDRYSDLLKKELGIVPNERLYKLVNII